MDLIEKSIEYHNEHYKDLDILKSFETRIRQVLSDQLNNCYSENYLEKGFPKELLQEIEDKIIKEKSEEPYQFHINPFELCTINNYKTIILHNWGNIFEKTFHSKSELKSNIANINSWRNRITHFRPVSEPIKLKALGSMEYFNKIIGF
ncbi:MAG: hypothetical protein HYT19_01740 [Candidatus Nealsonbacteria bacterium]|nr:hypothetical protein [Candidatus Nealsonbacteria bacterium]